MAEFISACGCGSRAVGPCDALRRYDACTCPARRRTSLQGREHKIRPIGGIVRYTEACRTADNPSAWVLAQVRRGLYQCAYERSWSVRIEVSHCSYRSPVQPRSHTSRRYTSGEASAWMMSAASPSRSPDRSAPERASARVMRR